MCRDFFEDIGLVRDKDREREALYAQQRAQQEAARASQAMQAALERARQTGTSQDNEAARRAGERRARRASERGTGSFFNSAMISDAPVGYRMLFGQ